MNVDPYILGIVLVAVTSFVSRWAYDLIRSDRHIHEEKQEKEAAFNLIEVPKEFESAYQEQREGGATNTNTTSGGGVDELATSCDLSHLIVRRRSIFPKDFVKSGEKVPLSIITEMLAAADWAPTHGKTQPWRFCVAGKATMAKLMSIRKEFVAEQLAGNEEMLEKANKKLVRKTKELQNVSAVIFIGMKRVLNAKGKLMPEWEEISAVACAVQNMHLQLTTHWNEGYCGYWSSSGWDSWLLDPRARDIIGLNGSESGEDDKILGAFFLGKADVKKMNGYRSSRSGMAGKVKWAY